MALSANLPLAKEDAVAEPRREAVAPVRMREGGWGEVGTASRRRGSVAWAKR